ncbi:hypothetical protein [Catellatospora paridis]|uniref:hypothetical protein n=1 Tax=Catellatospora paridis TaxID=1617086 RepID=UPI0012D3A4FE|nr:hypothetical protein [Catellatospora paridis]
MDGAATWLSAIATACGSLGTMGALLLTYLLLRREAERDRVNEVRRSSEEASARRAQAAKVSAWARTEPKTVDAVPTVRIRYGAYVHNGSESPVFDLTVFWLRQRTSDARDASWENVRIMRAIFPVFPPTAEPRFIPCMSEGRKLERAEALPSGEEPTALATAITFRDSNGVNWLRRVDGRLVEEPADDEPLASDQWMPVDLDPYPMINYP